MDPASAQLTRFLVKRTTAARHPSRHPTTPIATSLPRSDESRGASRAADQVADESGRTAPPRARILSLGAGVQSTALLLLAARGRIEPFDLAIFADTGWEPAEVYQHLDRLENEIARPAGIPIARVSFGNLREESMSEDYTTTLPLFITNADGSGGMLNRQCTQNYKILPIYRHIRLLLGARNSVHPCTACEGHGRRISPAMRVTGLQHRGECSVCKGTGDSSRVGPVRDHDAWVSMAIGFSTDEIVRVSPSRRKYVTHSYPLLDLGWSRADALGFLTEHGFAHTPRSACIGCPYHSQAEWRRLRSTSPTEWQDVVEFDERIRHAPGSTGLRGETFLHRARVPLAHAVDTDSSEPERPGCSPFGCRTMADVDAALETQFLDEDEQPHGALPTEVRP